MGYLATSPSCGFNMHMHMHMHTHICMHMHQDFRTSHATSTMHDPVHSLLITPPLSPFLLRSRVEWVADDGMCGSVGCTLPRTHHGSCRPEILSGKRERRPEAPPAGVTLETPDPSLANTKSRAE